MTTPVPGGRIDAARRAIEHASPGLDGLEAAPAPSMSPVPVIVAGRRPALRGRYSTITIQASTAGVPAVRQLLPADPDRQIAYIVPVSGAVIIATSKEQAQDPQNIMATPSAGFSTLPPAITHREEVWGANPSTGGSVIVSLFIETGADE